MCFLTHFLLHLMKCLSLSHIAITLLTRPMAILNVVHIFLFDFFFIHTLFRLCCDRFEVNTEITKQQKLQYIMFFKFYFISMIYGY